MDKGGTRKGRKSKLGAVRNSKDEGPISAPELVNGASGKEKLETSEDSSHQQNLEGSIDYEEMKIKEEDVSDDAKANNTDNPDNPEFHGFDETSDASGASVLNQLVGKYEADLGSKPKKPSPRKESNEAVDSEDVPEVLGQDIYTDSEDESSKVTKGTGDDETPKGTKATKLLKSSTKKRPLEKLAAEEEFNDDEKPATPPPAKRPRKKSAKLKEAAADSMVNMKLLSDVSSEVTSSEDVPRKSKVKEEASSEVTSSGSLAKKNAEVEQRRGRHSVRDVSDPIYLVPLDAGWRRELVYRGTGPKGNDGKRTGDIYYYTPEGKKVRSRVEILEHLRDTGLTTEHFCFVKEPLGLDDSAKEIIRDASVRKSDIAFIKKEKSPKLPKQKTVKGVNAIETPGNSNDATSAASASPVRASGAKNVTPKVVLKGAKSPKGLKGLKGPKGPRAKATPTRKANTDGATPVKARGRPKKDKEAPKPTDASNEDGVLLPTSDAGDQEAADATPGSWKVNSVQLPLAPRPPAPSSAGPSPSEPPAPPQTVATIGGQKFIVVPKHNVLAVSSGTARAVSPSAAVTPSSVYYIPGNEAGLSNAGYSTDLLASKRVKVSESTDATVESTTASSQNKTQAPRYMDNFISDLSNGYNALFHVMGYLKVQELLRASRVCRMWRDLSLHPNLWHTVRMKNSQVTDWDGFAAALSARGTRVLDLRKMLAPGSADDILHMWSEFNRVIGKCDSLQRVELSRCPASVFEELALSCSQLRVINAVAIKSEEVDLEPIKNVPLLEELRLKSNTGMNITRTLDPLLTCRLKHLSLTSVKNLGSCNIEVISQLHNLESLELGDCIKLSESFGPDHLSKLSKLQRLRLEKGAVPGCPVISIIESIAELPALQQLEMINFDVKTGFDKALAKCKQLRRLLIIPTYITTSASTNHMVLCSLPLLSDSLEYLVWGLTQELTRVTDLFIDQCEARKGAQGSSKLNAFPGECIPIVKPVLNDEKEKNTENGQKEDEKDEGEKMDVDEDKTDTEKGKDGDDKSQKEKEDHSDSDEVDCLARDFRILSSMEQTEAIPMPPVRILPIPKLHKLLVLLLPNTRVKILKVPFPSTWRQTFPELSTF